MHIYVLRSFVAGAPLFLFLTAVAKAAQKKPLPKRRSPKSELRTAIVGCRLQLKKKEYYRFYKMCDYRWPCRLTRPSQPVQRWIGHGLCQPLARVRRRHIVFPHPAAVAAGYPICQYIKFLTPRVILVCYTYSHMPLAA